MATYNFQRIAASFIVKNNRAGVISTLVNNNLIADTSAGNRLTNNQLSDVLYSYYLTNGKVAYASLLNQIPVNEELSASENTILDAASNDMRNVLNIAPINNNDGVNRTIDFKSSAKSFWDLLVGASTSTVEPVVTTTTKASPLTIGLIIGGIGVLAIIAWVVIKYR